MKKSKMLCAITSVLMAFLLFVLSVSAPVGALSTVATANKNKIDSALKEKMATASPDEKIPVAIWYADVDQDNIDKLTAEKVGFTQDDVAVAYEMPSTELLASLEKEEAGATDETQAYLKRTERQRELERQRTDEYIMTRREFSREKYNAKSADIIKDIKIKDEDITFKSQYAPMILAELTVSEVLLVIKNSYVISVVFFENRELIEDSLISAKEATGVNKINNNSILGLTGADVKVGLIDSNVVYVANTGVENRYIVPNNSVPSIKFALYARKIIDYGNVVIVDNNNTPNPTGSHADAVANTLLSVSPGITLYSCAIDEGIFDFSTIEAMIAEGVQLISLSGSYHELETSDEYVYSIWDKWFDHIVAFHGITALTSAGNTGNNNTDYTYIDENGKEIQAYGPVVGAPGLAYNVITVGAYNDESEPDTFRSYTSYRNSITREDDITLIGCEKPDVVVPDTFNGEYTSNSTPFLAGIIALIYELKPSLAMYPQATKAIVLASCHRKVVQTSADGGQETIYQGITDRQGAGAPDAWIMTSIVCNGTYGVGRIKGARTQAVRRFVMPSYDASKINVSLTWIKENTYDNIHHETFGYLLEGDYVNLNLSVYNNGNEVGSSNLAKSSTEMAYFNINNTEKDYEIRINKANTSYTETVRFGYAYSTDKPFFPAVTEEIGVEDCFTDEGIYYIRNYYTDKYLTLDTTTGETTMQDFATTAEGRQNQIWVLKGTQDDYELLPAYGSVGQKLNFGAQVGTNPYYKSVIGTSDLNLRVESWETDTSLEPDAYVFKSTSGGSNNIMSYTYSTGVFVRSETESVVNMYRMWVLEDINYRRGDVDLDGAITIKDATAIQKNLSNMETFNNVQNYLADYDFDRAITIKDVTAIQKYLALKAKSISE